MRHGLAKMVRPKPSTSTICIHKSRKPLREELRNNKRMVIGKKGSHLPRGGLGMASLEKGEIPYSKKV